MSLIPGRPEFCLQCGQMRVNTYIQRYTHHMDVIKKCELCHYGSQRCIPGYRQDTTFIHSGPAIGGNTVTSTTMVRLLMH